MMRRKSNANNIDHSNVSTMKNKNHVRLCSLSILECLFEGHIPAKLLPEEEDEVEQS